MSIDIVVPDEAHFDGMRQALDKVARERRFLAFTQAPSAEAATAFYRHIRANGLCQMIALQTGTVVGWCDILPVVGEARAHVGTLGMGIVPEHRGRGIGSRLLTTTLAKAWTSGLTRVELTVRTDNVAAIRLYERCGFAAEGTSRNAFRVDGVYFDACCMALLK